MLIFQILLILLDIAVVSLAIKRLINMRETFFSKDKYSLGRYPFHPDTLKNQSIEAICYLLYNSNFETLNKQAGPQPVWLNLMAHKAENNRQLMRQINAYLIRMHYLVPDPGWIEGMISRTFRQQEQLLRFLLPVPALLGFACFLLRNDQVGWAGLAVGLLSSAGMTIGYFFFVETCHQRIAELTDFVHGMLPRQEGTAADAVRNLKNELHNFRLGMAEDVSKLLTANREQLLALQQVQREQVDAINRESEMLEKISRLDFPQIVRFNTDVLNQLKTTIDNFGLFTHLSESLGALLSTMDRLTLQINTGVQRTADIGAIASAIQKTVERNTQLQEFLSSHTSVLSDRKKLIQDTVGGMDETLSRSLKELQLHLQEQVTGIRTITLHEQEVIGDMIRKGNLRFEKLDLLDGVVREMTLIRKPLEQQQSALPKLIAALESMNKEMVSLRAIMEKKRFF
jgi:hypothetical protein